jgi:ATP-dependent Clp protease protease subunit
MMDTMKHIKNDVVTINVGLAASMGAMILTSGTKGKRYALPESYTMIHQPLNMGVGGQASDIEISAKHILRIKDRFTQILAETTGQDPKKVHEDMDRNNWMSAEETKNYGIVDEIMLNSK